MPLEGFLIVVFGFVDRWSPPLHVVNNDRRCERAQPSSGRQDLLQDAGVRVRVVVMSRSPDPGVPLGDDQLRKGL